MHLIKSFCVRVASTLRIQWHGTRSSFFIIFPRDNFYKDLHTLPSELSQLCTLSDQWLTQVSHGMIGSTDAKKVQFHKASTVLADRVGRVLYLAGLYILRWERSHTAKALAVNGK
uniref:AlNc14C151G7539 protein n=1 Tax=Albugo laibachii Nc14 TaxID=890382 RepID=F0WM28_9STRA|nr:AlNc14C151G7539 [Albugo laibachii Nc14]|eukprot:CCA22355.1 AlNc14C151G7539 [Albugo laibachii Nc14]